MKIVTPFSININMGQVIDINKMASSIY